MTAQDPPGGSERAPARGTETILVVDDTEAVLKSVRRALTSLGYTIVTAPDGAAALRRYREHGDTIGLVVLDVAMPGMTGPDVYETLRREGRAPKVLFTSGSAGFGEIGERFAELTPVNFLPKPWTTDQLARNVRAVLDGTD